MPSQRRTIVLGLVLVAIAAVVAAGIVAYSAKGGRLADVKAAVPWSSCASVTTIRPGEWAAKGATESAALRCESLGPVVNWGSFDTTQAAVAASRGSDEPLCLAHADIVSSRDFSNKQFTGLCARLNGHTILSGEGTP
jgi:hypothetical protein